LEDEDASPVKLVGGSRDLLFSAEICCLMIPNDEKKTVAGFRSPKVEIFLTDKSGDI
jgi:hypothetical protein